eukprot:813414-Amphidinium_carterae.1
MDIESFHWDVAAFPSNMAVLPTHCFTFRKLPLPLGRLGCWRGMVTGVTNHQNAHNREPPKNEKEKQPFGAHAPSC